MVHGLESLPADETKVRVRPAAVAGNDSASVVVRNANGKTMRVMAAALLLNGDECKSQADVLQPPGCSVKRIGHPKKAMPSAAPYIGHQLDFAEADLAKPLKRLARPTGLEP